MFHVEAKLCKAETFCPLRALNARPKGAMGASLMKPQTPPQTYRVKSFGCQMNVYDGERMAELLGERGIQPAPEGEEADLVILNTCHNREKAAEKVYSDIGRLVAAGKEKPPELEGTRGKL